MIEPFPKPKPIEKKEEGCDIRIKRDNNGRVIGIKTNSRCTRAEIDLFKESNGVRRENLDENEV